MENQSARQSTIEDVKNDDFMIQVTGYVKEIIENQEILLDDKTGTIKVALQDIEFLFKKGDLINVIGELVINTSGEKSVKPKFFQDMNNLNFSYYQKLYELKKELLKQ